MARRVGREREIQVKYLEDRVGVATLSRLYEMCRIVPITDAEDYRTNVKMHGRGL